MRCHLEKCGPYTQYMRQHAEHTLDGLHACVGWNRLDDHSPITSERLWEMLLRILVLVNLPFAFVENEKFCKMLHEAFLNCQIPRCQTMPELLSANTLHAALELCKEVATNESTLSLVIDV